MAVLERPVVVQLDNDHIVQAGAILARAFHDDPMHCYVLSDNAARREKFPPFYRALVRLGLLQGKVWGASRARDANPEAAAVAFLIPAEAFPRDVLERSGWSAIPDLLGAEAWSRFEVLGRAVEAETERVVARPYWSLSAVGVEPTLRRRGLGRALVDRFVQQAGEDNLPATLMTFENDNVPFYQRRGFAVVGQGSERTSGLPYWIFARGGSTP